MTVALPLLLDKHATKPLLKVVSWPFLQIPALLDIAMSTLCALNADYPVVKTILQFLSCNVVEYDSQAIIYYSLVSKLWRSIILNELNWHTVFRTSFAGEVNPVKGFTTKLVDIIAGFSLYHIKIDNRFIIMENRLECKHTSPNSDELQKFISFFHSPEMHSTKGLWRNSVVVSPADSDTIALELICQINISVVKKITKNGENLATAFLRSSLAWQFIPPSTPFKSCPSLPLSVKFFPTVQPKGFVSGFLMRDYQLSTLNWLLHIEKSQKERQCYENLTSWNTESGKFYIGKEYFVNPPELDSYKKVNYTVRGGLLLYFKHLGPRVEIISLILSTLNKYEIPILENVLTPTRATLIMCTGWGVAKEWQKEIAQITSPKLKVLVLDKTVTRDLVVNADVVIGYNGEEYNEKTIYQFIWARVVLEYLVAKPNFVTNLHAKNWWLVLCSSSLSCDLHYTMNQLGFPPQTVSEFVTKYVWATYMPRTSADRHSSFTVEYRPIPLTEVEICHYMLAQITKTANQIFCVNTTLDEEKKRLIPYMEAALKRCLDKINQNPDLIADVIQYLWCYAIIVHSRLYDGPQTSVAEVMHRVSDALLAQQISDKGDINETQDILLASQEGPSKNQSKQDNQNNKVTSPNNTRPPVIGSKKEKPFYREIQKGYILPFLTNEFGSLIGNLLLYLRDLWIRDPSARVLVFTSIQPQLRRIYTALDSAGIATGIISNQFAGRRVAVRESTTNKHPLRVLLTDHVLYETISFAVSHIFFLSFPVPEIITKLYSSCYPQGQRQEVVAVTYFWLHTEEHVEYYKRHLTTVPVNSNFHTEHLKPISSKSVFGSLIVNSHLDQYSLTIRKLINYNTR